MQLSIVIPAFNEEKFLGQSLERIQQALHENRRRGVAWESVVCDNNSTDRTAEIAAQSGARVVNEPTNQMSRARNAGPEGRLRFLHAGGPVSFQLLRRPAVRPPLSASRKVDHLTWLQVARILVWRTEMNSQ
jgi:glycosyltransferase involved in cell wall biosynthesis